MPSYQQSVKTHMPLVSHFDTLNTNIMGNKLFVQQYQTHRRSISISLLVRNSHFRVTFWRQFCPIYLVSFLEGSKHARTPHCLETWSRVITKAPISSLPFEFSFRQPALCKLESHKQAL